MKTLSLVAAVLLSGCAMTFDLVGGPRNERSSLPARDVLEAMEPKVKTSASAVSAIASLRTRSRVGNVLTWSGLGMLAPCIGVPALSKRLTDVTLGVMVATCSTTIVLEVIALFVLPKLGDYGSVLRAFNADFPETPFTSVALGVEAPRR